MTQHNEYHEPEQGTLFEVSQDTGYDVGVPPIQRTTPHWAIVQDAPPTLYGGKQPVVAYFITASGTHLPYTLTALIRRDSRACDVPSWVLHHAGVSCAANRFEGGSGVFRQGAA